MGEKKGYTREDIDRMVTSGMRIEHEQDRKAMAGLLARWLAGGDENLAQHTASELERQGLPAEVLAFEVHRGLDMVPARGVRMAVSRVMEAWTTEAPTVAELAKWAETSSGHWSALYAGLADWASAQRDGLDVTAIQKRGYSWAEMPPPGEFWQTVWQHGQGAPPEGEPNE